MRIRFNLRYLLISALFFSLQVCHAQSNAPTTVTFSFGTSEGSQLWDLSGGYSLNLVVSERNGVQVPLQVNFNLVEDARGNLTSPAGDFQALTLNGMLFTVSYTIAGKVTTDSSGTTHARFTIRMTGNGTVGGLTINSMSAIIVVNATPNAEDGLLHGPARFSARFSNGVEGVSGTIQDIATALPPGVDGTWTLTLQATAFNSLVGTAVVTTPTRTFGLIVTGPFSQANQAFVVTLRGSGAVANTSISGVGSNAKAMIDQTLDTIGGVGKLMGQRVLLSSD